MVEDTASLFGLATESFDRLSQAVQVGHDSKALIAALAMPLRPLSVASPPAWASNISDDGTPFELSVALGDRGSEVRFLFEARGETPDLASRARAATALNQWLGQKFELDLSRLDEIENLFIAPAPEALFAMWHAVAFRRDRAPELRVYLNPHARGRDKAPAVVEEALDRLGISHGYRTLLAHALRRGPELDDLRYLSLDLGRSAEARVKIYVFHEDANLELLEEAGRPARNYVPGEITEFCRAMAGGGPFASRAVATCWAFTSDDATRPLTSTVHVPIRAYAPNDAVALSRLVEYLERRTLPADALKAAVDAVARRPLAAGSGLVTYASMRSEQSRPRVTAYLACEAYRTDPPRSAAMVPRAPRPVPSPEEIVRRREREPLTEHPYFQRSSSEPVDLGHMWRLFANIRSGLSLHFPRRLAAVVARVTDERVRSLLAKQLDEELGEGNYERAHLVLFDQMLAGLSAYRPSNVDDLDLTAGRVLEARLELPYADPDGWVGVGAAMVIEIFGKQVDRFVAEQFRRQQQVPPESLTWLNLHENLELEHAEESLDLAHLVPPTDAAHAAVARGATAVADAGWEFFDHLYRACYR